MWVMIISISYLIICLVVGTHLVLPIILNKFLPFKKKKNSIISPIFLIKKKEKTCSQLHTEGRVKNALVH